MAKWDTAKRIGKALIIPIFMGISTAITEVLNRQSEKQSKELLDRVKELTDKVDAILPGNGGTEIGKE